jgi:hypothetical protein
MMPERALTVMSVNGKTSTRCDSLDEGDHSCRKGRDC